MQTKAPARYTEATLLSAKSGDTPYTLLPSPITNVDAINTSIPSHKTVFVSALVPFHSRNARAHNAANIIIKDMCSDQLEKSYSFPSCVVPIP